LATQTCGLFSSRRNGFFGGEKFGSAADTCCGSPKSLEKALNFRQNINILKFRFSPTCRGKSQYNVTREKKRKIKL